VTAAAIVPGTAWAAHRQRQGWRPRFALFDDRRAALVLTRARPPLPGFLAYCPRGPIGAGDPPTLVASRATALAQRLRAEGATILAVDPELDADAASGGHGCSRFPPDERSSRRATLSRPAARTDAGLAAMSSRAPAHPRPVGGTTGGPAGEYRGAQMDATARRKRFNFGLTAS
jgi:hypothetical protein